MTFIPRKSPNVDGITQSQLWKGKHQHHDYEDNITMVLIIPYIASPLM